MEEQSCESVASRNRLNLISYRTLRNKALPSTSKAILQHMQADLQLRTV